MRGISGIEADEAGLEMGSVALDPALANLLEGDTRFQPLPAPQAMTYELFAFQERGHGWLRMLGDLGIGAILADDMGLGKTVQAIAMLLSEREEFGAKLGPTLVVCPMSVARQWLAEVERFAPSLRVHLHHGSDRLADEALLKKLSEVDLVDHLVRHRHARHRHARRDPLGPAAARRGAGRQEPGDQARRALRPTRARRRVAMTGTPIENHLGELWALMDILNPGLLGSREWFGRTFARPIQRANDEPALERLRAVVRPFILRRAKDSPEVELDLPPITVEKDYCRLTVEQASLYQATVDNWMPRIESHEDRFGRRGAVLAMLGHLKQVCNHPEMLLHTGQPLEGRSGKLERLVGLLDEMPADDKALVFTQYPRSTGSCRTSRSARRQRRLLPRPPERAAARRAADRVRDAGGAGDARHLDPRRRPRPQPAVGEPRLPLRPLVEPGRRAAGDRPRAPARAAQGGVRALARSAPGRSRSGSTRCSTRSASSSRR